MTDPWIEPEIRVNGVDVLAADEVQDRSISLRVNTVDFTLVDPAVIPIVGQSVTVDEPPLSCTISAVRTSEFEDCLYVDVTATNETLVGIGGPSPFGISDDPDDVTTTGYLNGSMTFTSTLVDGVSETTGECDIKVHGLYPGRRVEITNANVGLVAEEFRISDVIVSYPIAEKPIYHIIFGDNPITLKAAINRVGNPPPFIPILTDPGIVQTVSHSSSNAESENGGPVSRTTFDDPPGIGSIIVAVYVAQGAELAGITWPDDDDWTTVEAPVDLLGGSIIGPGEGIMRYRVSRGIADQSLVVAKGGSHYSFTAMAEITGVSALIDSAKADNVVSGPPPVPSIGPVTASADDEIAVGFHLIAGIDNDSTVDSPFTSAEYGQAGASPTVQFAVLEGLVADDDYTLSGTSDTGGSEQGKYAGVLAIFGGQSLLNLPERGMRVTEYGTGDGSTDEFQTNHPYRPGDLDVTVGGVDVVPVEIDPADGTFSLPFAPPIGSIIVVRYRAAGPTVLGGTLSYTRPTGIPSIPGDVIESGGRWEPVVFDGEIVYLDGDIVMYFVEG